MTLIYPGGDAQVTPNLGLATWGMDEVLAENMILIDAAVGSGGGSSVKVNGVTISNPNFNDTTPSAPSGSTNVTFQVSGSNVSSYVNLSDTPNLNIGDGISSIVFNTAASELTVNSVKSLFLKAASGGGLAIDAAANSLALTGPSGEGSFLQISGSDVMTIKGNNNLILESFLGSVSIISNGGGITVTDPSGSVWGTATGGSQGSGTINAQGLYVNGVAVVGGGTVTSFSAGALSPLFTTSVATATTTPALSFALTNAAQNSVFAGPASGGPGSPSYRALVSADIPSLSSLYLPLTGGALSGNLTLNSTVTDGSASVGTNGQLLSSTVTGVKWIDASSVGVTWSNLTSASANLTLSNANFSTTFDQTSAVIWDWANTTPTITGAVTTLALSTSVAPSNAGGNSWVYTFAATESGAGSNAWAGASVTIAGYTGGATGNNGTGLVVTASTTTTVTVTNATGTTTNTGAPTLISSAVSNSPVITLAGTVNSGTAGTLNSIADKWTLQTVIGSVAPNPTSQLQIVHTGSTGAASVMLPSSVTNVTTPSVVWNGGTAGYGIGGSGAVALDLYVPTGGAQVGIDITQAGTVRWTLQSGDNSAANQMATLANTTANYSTAIKHAYTTSTTNPGILLADNGGNSGHMAAVSGTTQIHVSAEASFVPASGASAFVAMRVQPTINQTSSATGNYTGLLVNAIETSLKGSSNVLLALQAGATGGTNKYVVNNSGILTVYGGNTTVKQGSAPILASSLKTAQTAAQSAVSLVSSTPAIGMWRVSFVATITTAATSAAVLGGTTGFTITYVNGNGDTVTKTTALTTPLGIGSTNSTADSASGDLYCYAGSATAITYSYGYTAGTGTPMQYDIAVYAEFLG